MGLYDIKLCRWSMAIDWKAFYANGGYSNENSDPQSYDDGLDDDEEYNDVHEE